MAPTTGSTKKWRSIDEAMRVIIDTEAAFVALCRYVNNHRDLWTALLKGAAGVMHTEPLRASQNLIVHRERHVDWIPVGLSVICSVTVIVETLAWRLKQPEDDILVKSLAKMLTHLTIANSRSSPRQPVLLPKGKA